MRGEKLPAQNALSSQPPRGGVLTGRAIMEAVYRQARAVLDKAAAATNKDQKTAQISLLVELCAYRGDSALVAEVVEGVAGYAADRSAKVRKAVVEFVDAVVARGKLQVTDECASTALATCCVLAVDENEPVAAAALRGAARLLGDERFAAATVDDASRERLRNAVDPSRSGGATGRPRCAGARDWRRRRSRPRTARRPAASPRRGAPPPRPARSRRRRCLLYTSPSPRDGLLSRMPSSA